MKLPKDPLQAFMCSEALMVNGQWEPALELLDQANESGGGVRLRCFRLQPVPAFKSVGIEDARRDAVSWFSCYSVKLAARSTKGTHELRIGLQLVEALHALGEREQAMLLLQEVLALESEPADPRR
jgi:hypothetical protein